MLKTSVVIVKGKQPSEMVDEALKLIKAERLIKQEDNVLIKPNYFTVRHTSTGVITDSRIVESLIEFIKISGLKDTTVEEGGSGDSRSFKSISAS
ncbi:MAG: hypothetical protein V1850_02770 [Candidatus Bathyarchaeota archaeon]